MSAPTAPIDPADVRLVGDEGPAERPSALADDADELAPEPARPRRFVTAARGERPPIDRRRAVVLGVAWVALVLIGTLLVVYPLGALFQARDQRQLLTEQRTAIYQAANDTEGLAGLLEKRTPPAPDIGAAVAILDIGRVRVSQVVVEGTGADQTARGPGHVPGTAGLGQPGNAAIIGRHAGWGAPFGRLAELRPGDRIVVTTTQGQSQYRVARVRTRPLRSTDLGPTSDDRLTLVTSARAWPLATSPATIVTAELVDQPFEPTPQRGREPGAARARSDAGNGAELVLVLGALAWLATRTVEAHRRWRPLTAYLVTTPAIVVLTIVAGELLGQRLPIWT